MNEIIEIEGLLIGGLTGIIGNPQKNFRWQEEDYLKALSKLLREKPHILLTHLSPAVAELNLQGDERLNIILENGHETILFCGHSYWNYNNVYKMKNGTQILNADKKVFILIKE